MCEICELWKSIPPYVRELLAGRRGPATYLELKSAAPEELEALKRALPGAVGRLKAGSFLDEAVREEVGFRIRARDDVERVCSFYFVKSPSPEESYTAWGDAWRLPCGTFFTAYERWFVSFPGRGRPALRHSSTARLAATPYPILRRVARDIDVLVPEGVEVTVERFPRVGVDVEIVLPGGEGERATGHLFASAPAWRRLRKLGVEERLRGRASRFRVVRHRVVDEETLLYLRFHY